MANLLCRRYRSIFYVGSNRRYRLFNIFFLLKKQLEKKKTGKIFVPIRNVTYSNTYYKKSEFEDLENYLWLFTKDWPLIYEVYDKSENLSIHIVGETEVFEKIRSPYRLKLLV